jgi:hypothetical protein
MLKGLSGPAGLLQIMLLAIVFGLVARSESGAAEADAEEVYVVVFEMKPDGRKGPRIYRDTFYLAPTEKRSAVVRPCGMDLFNYQDKVEALDGYRREGRLVIVYRSRIDPVSKNTKREEICRIEE